MSSSDRSRHPHRKRWGQNFLRNPAAVRKIADAVSASKGDLILEIGPGEGALTSELAGLGARLRLIEIDPMLIAELRIRFADDEVEVIHGDALEVDLPDVPFHAVGNLPYNVANPIIRRILRDPRCRGALFMVQKEVADRYVASRGDDAYGYLTLATRLYADAKKILTLGPSSFHPRPKVTSAVVRFEPRDAGLQSNRELLEGLLSRSFRQRRKKLSRNLDGFNDRSKDEIERILAELSIDPSVRAERLDLEDFDRIAVRLTD